jgi:hypothetical protein
MANNSTNINKTNNHLSPWTIDSKKDHNIMAFEIQVLASDRHTDVAGLNHLIRIPTLPILIWILILWTVP